MSLESILNIPKNKDAWNQLKRLYSSKSVIPFVGAGLSIPVYPSWRETLMNLFNKSSGDKARLEYLLNLGDYEGASELVRTSYEEDDFFYSELEAMFAPCTIDKTKFSKSLNCLPRMFDGPVITTNIDRCLEDVFNDFSDTVYLRNVNNPSFLVSNGAFYGEHILYKIHGDVKDRPSLVFLKSEYDLAYSSKAFTQSVFELARHRALLFIGCSLGSDRYLQYLEKIRKEESGRRKILHFAFMPIEDGVDIESRREELKRYSITPIWYPVVEGSHEALFVLLSNLSDTPQKNCSKDLTHRADHFNVFDKSYTIDQIFVDDCFTCSLKRKDGTYLFEKKSQKLYEIFQLIQDNRIVCIEGNFGIGKTALSLRLQQLLIDAGKETRFYQIEDFFHFFMKTKKYVTRMMKCMFSWIRLIKQ